MIKRRPSFAKSEKGKTMSDNTLLEQLNQDIKAAMKNKEKEKLERKIDIGSPPDQQLLNE